MKKKKSLQKWYKKAAFIGLIGLLMACDPQTTQASAINTDTTEKVVTETKTVATSVDLKEMSKKYQNKTLEVVDISELQLDGANAMVVTFSIPLNPKQNFEKVIHIVDAALGKLDGAWELADNLMELRFRHLEPNRKLVLTIDPSILAVNGEQLGKERQERITTRDILPTVGFVSRGSLLPTKVVQGIPVITQNVNSVDVNFYRINEEFLPAFLSDWRSSSSISTWDIREYTRKTQLVYSGRFDLNPARNTRENIILPIANIEQLNKPGVYFAIMNEAGAYSYYNPATVFMLSDVGVSVHRYRDQLDIFTQSLANGASLADVDVRLLGIKGQELYTAKTDKKGHVQIPKNDKGVLLIATYKGQTSVIDLTRSALDLTEFTVGGPEFNKKQLFTFGPRDLYRPGETLIINGLMRNEDGRLLPDQPIKADILNPSSQVVRSFIWQPKDGLYQYQYKIADSAATGNWTIRFDVGDDSYRNYSFKVEDFLPERMALDITTVAQGPVLPNSAVEFDVKGRYLYGAPASGNALQGQLFLRPLRSLTAYPGFEFGSITELNLSRHLGEIDQNLNNEGLDRVTVNSSWSDSKSLMTLVLQASLLESGGRPVTRRIEQAIWPAMTVPGIRAGFDKSEFYDYSSDRYVSDYSVDEDSIANFEIVYANAKGEKVAANNLRARLIHERRDYYWTWSQSNGWQSNYNQKEFVVAEEIINIDEGNIAKVGFLVDWGSFRIEVEDPKTKVVSSLRFWAGYRWQDNSSGSGAVRPDQVKLKLDKPAYSAGDKAVVHVEAPAAGQGYLLVESSDGPLWWQSISVPVGGASFEIPVDKAWQRHDIYLTAQVIREGDKQQQVTPKRAVGVLHLPLAEDSRRLNIQLETPTNIRPEQTITVKVKAKTQDGKVPEKINVLLSAVDSGVLNITRFVTPDPFESFLGRKRYGVDQMDVYGQLIEGKGRLGTLRFGGDSDEEFSALSRGGKKPVTKVVIVAQQLEPVTLDSNGEGEIKLTLPDFNGELRLMTQAWTDSEFGKADKEIVVAAPLVVELAMPRFLAGGDQSTFALDLRNLSGQEQEIDLNLSVEGLIKLNTPANSKVKLADGERQTVRIPVTAVEGFGQGRLTIAANGIQIAGESELLNIERSWTIGVRSAYPAVTQGYNAVLHKNGQLILPINAMDELAIETTEAELVLSSRPPLNVAQYIRELYAYPYGCTEQTTSGLFPSLYANSGQLKEMGIRTSTDAERRTRIIEGIDRLLNRQRDNGSFGFWSKDDSESYWLTVYVTDFLIRAREQGYAVDPQALEKAITRLQHYVQDRSSVQTYYSLNNEYTKFAVRSYAGLVLARQNRVSLSGLRQLYSNRGVALSGLPLVQLGVALKIMGDESRAETLIQSGLAKSRDSSTYRLEDYGSAIRDNALLLSLLYEQNIVTDERDKKLLTLSDELHAKHYLSTQERNAVFMAGRHFMGANETAWQADITGEALSNDKQVTKIFNAPELSKGLTITNTGDATLYPRISLVGSPLAAPKPVSNGLSIKRTFYNLNGDEIKLNTLKSGELILVSLEVSSNSFIPDALVVDLLPAGLELENQNLGQSSASLSQSGSNLQALQRQMEQTQIEHQEFRDDRYVAAIHVNSYGRSTLLYLARAVTPGVYRVPAPIVESMYRAELNAIAETPDILIVE